MYRGSDEYASTHVRMLHHQSYKCRSHVSTCISIMLMVYILWHSTIVYLYICTNKYYFPSLAPGIVGRNLTSKACKTRYLRCFFRFCKLGNQRLRVIRNRYTFRHSWEYSYYCTMLTHWDQPQQRLAPNLQARMAPAAHPTRRYGTCTPTFAAGSGSKSPERRRGHILPQGILMWS